MWSSTAWEIYNNKNIEPNRLTAAKIEMRLISWVKPKTSIIAFKSLVRGVQHLFKNVWSVFPPTMLVVDGRR